MTGPLRAAVSALLADITRWNTSCCGIEPSIMVIAGGEEEDTMSVELRLGQEAGTGPALVGQRDHLVGAAGQVAGEHGDARPGPPPITIIWMKSVTATDHMPPNSV